MGVMTETLTSFEDIVAARAPALLRLAVMLTGNAADAEDLLQDALVAALPHARRIEGMQAPAAYLRRAVVTAHLGAVRRRARRPRSVGLDARGSTVADPRTAPDGMPGPHGLLWQSLGDLTPPQRATLVLRYYEDLPDTEIAEILGCPAATVRSHALRGLRRLRDHLHDLDPEEL